jgi:hypothetical protein
MDRFFSAVGSLMSLLIRSITEATLTDLFDFLDEYQNGNYYNGTYNFFKDLALPHRRIPFVFYFLIGGRDLDNRTTTTTTTRVIEMSPSLEHTQDRLDYIFDLIITCLDDLPRVECLLFQQPTQHTQQTLNNNRYYNTVRINEEIIVKNKKRFANVLEANSLGPQLLV